MDKGETKGEVIVSLGIQYKEAVELGLRGTQYALVQAYAYARMDNWNKSYHWLRVVEGLKGANL